MKAVIQRVSKASVEVENEIVGKIEKGFLILLGVKTGDEKKDAEFLAKKCCAMRIFEDENEKMNLSLQDIGAKMLVISQFTLYGDAQKGNRPSFIGAAEPIIAEELYNYFINYCKEIIGSENVATGSFRKMMNVELTNYGPVTIIIES